jgi:hypothetical protein
MLTASLRTASQSKSGGRPNEQIFRAFAVSRAILSWEAPSPARPDEILAARHAAAMQHAMMQHAMNGDGEQAAHLEASDLGEKLEQAVRMALNEVVAILGFSLNPDDRAFSSILKAKTTILSSVLSEAILALMMPTLVATRLGGWKDNEAVACAYAHATVVHRLFGEAGVA